MKVRQIIVCQKILGAKNKNEKDFTNNTVADKTMLTRQR